jgi:hypothetical protein
VSSPRGAGCRLLRARREEVDPLAAQAEARREVERDLQVGGERSSVLGDERPDRRTEVGGRVHQPIGTPVDGDPARGRDERRRRPNAPTFRRSSPPAHSGHHPFRPRSRRPPGCRWWAGPCSRSGRRTAWTRCELPDPCCRSGHSRRRRTSAPDRARGSASWEPPPARPDPLALGARALPARAALYPTGEPRKRTGGMGSLFSRPGGRARPSPGSAVRGSWHPAAIGFRALGDARTARSGQRGPLKRRAEEVDQRLGIGGPTHPVRPLGEDGKPVTAGGEEAVHRQAHPGVRCEHAPIDLQRPGHDLGPGGSGCGPGVRDVGRGLENLRAGSQPLLLERGQQLRAGAG